MDAFFFDKFTIVQICEEVNSLLEHSFVNTSWKVVSKLQSRVHISFWGLAEMKSDFIIIAGSIARSSTCVVLLFDHNFPITISLLKSML